MQRGVIADNVWRNCNHDALSGCFDDVLITDNLMIDVRQGSNVTDGYRLSTTICA